MKIFQPQNHWSSNFTLYSLEVYRGQSADDDAQQGSAVVD